jgi:secondary thiamine-phosphate synthase enzyme
MKVTFQNHDLATQARSQFIDITQDVLDVVDRSEVKDGMAVVYSPHTTCSIVVNEREKGFLADFAEVLDGLVPADRAYRHDDLSVRTENLEDDPHENPNGHAHCRGALMASASQTFPIRDGKLMLGRWQRVFFVELDCARERKVFIQVLGE